MVLDRRLLTSAGIVALCLAGTVYQLLRVAGGLHGVLLVLLAVLASGLSIASGFYLRRSNEGRAARGESTSTSFKFVFGYLLLVLCPVVLFNLAAPAHADVGLAVVSATFTVTFGVGLGAMLGRTEQGERVFDERRTFLEREAFATVATGSAGDPGPLTLGPSAYYRALSWIGFTVAAALAFGALVVQATDLARIIPGGIGLLLMARMVVRLRSYIDISPEGVSVRTWRRIGIDPATVVRCVPTRTFTSPFSGSSLRLVTTSGHGVGLPFLLFPRQIDVSRPVIVAAQINAALSISE